MQARSSESRSIEDRSSEDRSIESRSSESRSRHWHATIVTRLQAGDPVALTELYDATSATIFAYALRTATCRDDAWEATLNAYRTAWQAPQLLADVRVPVELRLASFIRCTSPVSSPVQVTRTQSRKLP